MIPWYILYPSIVIAIGCVVLFVLFVRGQGDKEEWVGIAALYTWLTMVAMSGLLFLGVLFGEQ